MEKKKQEDSYNVLAETHKPMNGGLASVGNTHFTMRRNFPVIGPPDLALVSHWLITRELNNAESIDPEGWILMSFLLSSFF